VVGRTNREILDSKTSKFKSFQINMSIDASITIFNGELFTSVLNRIGLGSVVSAAVLAVGALTLFIGCCF
jgi:hypothetical protein